MVDSIQPTVDKYLLTPFQQSLVAGQSLHPQSPLYNMAMAFSLQGAIDAERFSRAWHEVSARHSSLQSGLDPSTLTLTRIAPAPLQILDLRDAKDAQSSAAEWMEAQAKTAFDIQQNTAISALLQVADKQWIWFISIHHIFSDAISFSILWSELTAAYSGTVTPPPSASPFSGYAQFDADSAHALTCKKYWQSVSLPKPVMPYHSGGTVTTTQSLRYKSVLTEEHLRGIERIVSGDVALTTHMARSQLLICAVMAYLYRVSGQSEIAISLPVPCRNRTYQNCIGPLIEMLPLSISIADDETFLSLLKKIKIASIELYKHALPGAARWIRGADTSVVFNYITTAFGPLKEIPVSAEWLHSGHADTNHLLRFQVTNWSVDTSDNSGIPKRTPKSIPTNLHIDFNTAHFCKSERETAIKNWHATVSALIESMLGPADLAVTAYDITGNTNDSNIIRDPGMLKHRESVNSENLAAQGFDNVVEQFRQIAITHADRIAIADSTTDLSYERVLRRIEELAFSLQKTGVKKSDRVALLLPRAPCVPIAMFATLLSDAAFVPIDIDTPIQRVQQILQDAEVSCVVTTGPHASLVPASYTTCLIDHVGAQPSQSDDGSNSLPAIENEPVEPSQPAYIIYTSGSTGEPKGVVISRGAMSNYISWAVSYYTKGKSLAFPLFTPLGFDLTITSLFVPLLSGGQLRVYPPHSRDADNALAAVIEDNCVDIVKLTPAHLAMLQDRDMSDSRISQLIVGGEDLKCALAQQIHRNFNGDIAIHNEYGPTEATVGCIVHRFNPQTDTDGSVPIGLPIGSMSATILNSKQQFQPPGVTGELYLEGPSLADGYWNRKAQTGEVFLLDCDARPNTRVYRTGDLARINRAGNLVYAGRMDTQVKIRGARVELAEIEAAALSSTQVAECVAVVIESDNARKFEEEVHCVRCGLSSRYPQAKFNHHGICSLCEAYSEYQQRSSQYFRSMDDLRTLIEKCRPLATGDYDCLMLLSGGKDSSYALARLVDLKLRVLAYTLDNGYLSVEAKENISRVCKTLGVNHQFGATPAMPEIFADSLKRFSNVCNGCFKTIYTLGMKEAYELKIPMIFTGLSRGQFFETRLNEELFTRASIEPDDIDEWVLSARKAYHRSDDAVSTHIDTEVFKKDQIFDAVKIVDFYRYCDVELDQMMHYLQTKLPWQRPRDTGRSTNCLINDVGIHVHKIEQGYHNYSLPYSWDVRLGHKRREAALQELDDQIDESHVNRILTEINYRIEEPALPSGPHIALYFTGSGQPGLPAAAPNFEHQTSSDSVDTDTLTQQLKDELGDKLPRWMIPRWLIPMERMALSTNGKIDRSALPSPLSVQQGNTENFAKPETAEQKLMASIWSAELGLEHIGIRDNFFSIGGDSLTAIRIISEFNGHGYGLNIADLFENQTVEEVCSMAGSRNARDESDTGTEPEAFSQLSDQQKNKLAQLLNK